MKITIAKLILILSFFINNLIFAQETEIDSLKQIISDIDKQCLEPCDADTAVINAYNNLVAHLAYQMPDSAQKLGFIAEDIARKLINNTSSEIVLKKTKLYLSLTLNNIGYLYGVKGDILNQLKYYNESLDIRKKLNVKNEIAGSYNNIGSVYYYKGDIPKALNYWNNSLKIREEINDKEGLSISYNNIGYFHQINGDIEDALKYYNLGLKYSKELRNNRNIGIYYNNLATIYDDQGNIYRALEFHKKGLELRKKINDKSGIATTLNNMGYIYLNQGNLVKALEFYNQSLKIREEIGEKQNIAGSLVSIGVIYSEQSNYDKALEFYNRGLLMQKEIDYKQGIAITYRKIGFVHMKKGNLPLAKDYYNKSLKIQEDSGNKLGVIGSLINIGNIYFKQGNFILAKDYLLKGYESSKELKYPKIIKRTALRMRDVYYKDNNFEKSDALALEVIDIYNKSIISYFITLSESGQEKYFKTVASSYMDFNSYALTRKNNYPEITNYVYNNTIKNKGLLLKSSTAMRNAVLNSNDTLLINNYYKWIHLKKQIVKLYSKGEDTEELDIEANEYEKELVKSSVEFSDFNNLQNISWNDVKKRLKADEAAIEFIHFKLKDFKKIEIDEFTDRTLYCALIITPKSKHPEMIPLFDEKDLIDILGKFGSNNYNYVNGIYGKNTDVKTNLYNLIWAPIEESLKGSTKVYISPSGLLHKVSFSAIAKKQNTYLCDIYNIEVKSSTGKITETQKDLPIDDNLGEVSLFGGINYNTDSTYTKVWNYLEGTKSETEKINKILRKENIKVNYFSSDVATEEEFKLIASNTNILHIATHGFFYPDPKEIKKEEREIIDTSEIIFRGGTRGFGVNSFVNNNNPLMRSGLVFAGANDVWNKQNEGNVDDGVLTAQEVAHIDMRKTDLVVMSACETGLGDIIGSEGVYGLQRAFKMAGVNYMIMSLWQVPDKETEEFMTTFYKKLIKQKDIIEAFYETKKEMRTKYDPYFWAAFVLIE